MENKIKNCGDIRKNKMVIEFNELESSSSLNHRQM